MHQNFFDKILKPVMYKIGDDWATEKISIATEHVATNATQALVRIIMDKVAGSGKEKILCLCAIR